MATIDWNPYLLSIYWNFVPLLLLGESMMVITTFCLSYNLVFLVWKDSRIFKNKENLWMKCLSRLFCASLLVHKCSSFLVKHFYYTIILFKCSFLRIKNSKNFFIQMFFLREVLCNPFGWALLFYITDFQLINEIVSLWGKKELNKNCFSCSNISNNNNE